MPGSPAPTPDLAPPPTGWRALLHGERPVWIVCGVLLVLGVVLRVWNLHLPEEFSFDERHFVKNARRYLAATKDQNDHPPLGKLIIAGSMALFGDNPVAWRLPSLLSGFLNIGLAAALGRALFRDRLAAVLAAAIVAAEGLFLVYSRTALLDGVLVSLMLGSALAAVSARRPLHIGVGAALAGLAMCVKFSGVVMVAPVLLAALVTRPALPRWTPLLLALTPLTYGVAFSFALHRTGLPAGPLGIVEATRNLVDIHLGKSDWEHRWVSHWYTWFLPLRPMIMRWEREGEIVSTMVGIGNLAVWWGSQLVLLAAFVDLLKRGPRAVVARFLAPASEGEGFFGVHARSLAWVCLLWVLPLVPWMLTKRDSYLYHYLPTYGIGAVALGGAVAWLLRTRPRLGWAALGVIALVFVAYLPIWIELPIPRWWWRTLLFSPTWR